MTFSECMLVVCPHCSNKKELLNLTSGNTIDAKQWSDAKTVAPMLPELSPVQKCPHCGHYFYLNEALQESGENYSTETGWLSFEETVKAYHEICDGSQQQLQLFTLIIAWAFNDIIRDHHTPTEEQYGQFKTIVQDNLSRNVFAENLLLKSELYRETEAYDECIATLQDFNPEEDFLKNIKNAILLQAQTKNNRVFVLEE